jgi:hypothetical protein
MIQFAGRQRGQEMLTIDEARAVRDNSKSNAAFKANALKPGEWTYVRDETAESRSQAAFLDHYGDSGRLYVDSDLGPDVASRVVVLRETGREAAAPQAGVPADAISEQTVRGADRDWSKLVKNPAINEAEFAELGKLVEEAKAALKRQ